MKTPVVRLVIYDTPDEAFPDLLRRAATKLEEFQQTYKYVNLHDAIAYLSREHGNSITFYLSVKD